MNKFCILLNADKLSLCCLFIFGKVIRAHFHDKIIIDNVTYHFVKNLYKNEVIYIKKISCMDVFLNKKDEKSYSL
jgi:hypothetical protein